MTRHEDLVMVSCIFNEANSYKFISKYGVLYLIREESASLKEYSETEMVKWDLYWTDVVIETALKLKDNQMRVVYFMINLLGEEYLEETLNENKYNKRIFISCLERFFQSTEIPQKYKDIVKEKVQKLNI